MITTIANTRAGEAIAPWWQEAFLRASAGWAFQRRGRWLYARRAGSPLLAIAPDHAIRILRLAERDAFTHPEAPRWNVHGRLPIIAAYGPRARERFRGGGYGPPGHDRADAVNLHEHGAVIVTGGRSLVVTFDQVVCALLEDEADPDSTQRHTLIPLDRLRLTEVPDDPVEPAAPVAAGQEA